MLRDVLIKMIAFSEGGEFGVPSRWQWAGCLLLLWRGSG